MESKDKTIPENRFTFGDIEDINFQPASSTLIRQVFEIPDLYEPVKIVANAVLKGHQYKRPDLLGKTSNMNKKQYLYVLFLRNEIDSMLGKAVNTRKIHLRLCKEFPLWPRSAAESYYNTIAHFRKLYNQSKLFAGQPTPALYSWKYNNGGYACHVYREKDMLTFPWCRSQMKASKFADPRFFTEDEMKDFYQRKVQGDSAMDSWILPPLNDLHKIQKQIGKPLYNSMVFPDGYGIGSTLL